MNREGDRKREKGFVCFFRNHILETKITKPGQKKKKKKKKKRNYLCDYKALPTQNGMLPRSGVVFV